MPQLSVDSAVYETLQLMLLGHDEKAIRERLAINHPGMDQEDALRRVMDHLQGIGASDPDVIRGWAIDATRVMYQRLVDEGDYPNALKAIKQIMGLAPKPSDVYISNETNEHEDGPADIRKIG